MMLVECPCGIEVKAGDHAAGSFRKCPGCGGRVWFPRLDNARRSVPTLAASLSHSDKSVAVAERPVVLVGVRACDLYDLCRRKFARVGLAMNLPHIGHGLGVGLHEHPAISPTSEEVLAPGMVFCIEPLGVDPEAGGFAQEVLVYLTEQGPRVLSDYTDLANMCVIEA